MFESLITPKIGIALIKKQIEKQADLKAKSFDIIYHKDYDGLKFHVFTDDKKDPVKLFYPDNGGQLAHIITTMIMAKIDINIELDAFVLKTNESDLICTIYYQIKEGRLTNKYQEDIVLSNFNK